MTFLLRRWTSVVLLSIYVDDGIAATNDEKLYREFLTALRKDFELSDQGKLNWYLGVSVTQDLANKLTTLSQERYVKDVLERLGMTGATPVSTPMEANTHLSASDSQPAHKLDRKFRREYQRIVG